MKVLQVINSLGTGGAEKLLCDAMPLYNQSGETVDLLLLDGTQHPFLKVLQDRDSCKIISLGTGSVYNPLHIFRLARIIRKYDVIHVHLFPAFYWVAMAKLLSFSKAKLVYTEHCTSNRRMENPVARPIDRMIYRLYGKVVAISDEVRASICRHTRASGQNVAVVPNGIDLSSIKAAAAYTKTELGLPENTFVLLQVARFQAQKDQQTLIRALSHLPSDIVLLLVGTGELLEASKELAASLGLSKRVHFLGVRMDVPRLLKTADVVVLSSHFEGLSLSSIEGMASGKPFVASDVPGLSDVVQGAGILFAESNQDELAAILTRLKNDPDFYAETVAGCQSRASNYDISKMTDAYVRIFKEFAKANNHT